MIVDILIAPPAAGKTTAIINHVKTSTEKFIISSISKTLSRQSYEFYVESGGTGAIIIDSDNKDRSQSVTSAMKDAVAAENRVIFTTHMGIMEMDSYSSMSEYNLFIDEVPEFVTMRSMKFTHNSYKVLQYCEDIDGKKNTIYNLKLRDDVRDKLHDIAVDGRKRLDVVSESLLPVYRGLLRGTPVRMTFNDEGSSVIFIEDFSMNDWESFKSVTISCANFVETFTGYILKNVNKWDFRRSPLTDKIMFRQYPNTGRVTINVMTNRMWSRYVADQMTSNGTVYNVMMEKINTLLGNDYLYTINNYRVSMDGIQVQYNPHGLNRYTSYTDTVAMFSYNPLPWQIPILKDLAGVLGLDETALIDAFLVSKYLEPVFQLCTRGNIRDVNSIRPIRLFVPDDRAAQYLKNRYMPDAIIDKSNMIVVEHEKKESSKFNWTKRGISSILGMNSKERRAFYYYCETAVGVKASTLDPNDPKTLYDSKVWLESYREKKAKKS